MGDAAAELSHRIHALGQRQLLLGLAQDALHLHSLGNVPGDRCEGDDFSVFVADRVDDAGGPKTGSVLAHAPALGLETSLARGRRKHPRRYAGCLILLGMKHAPADDLVGRIAVDAFCAAIPGCDDAAPVDLEDRIVDHRLDEVAEPALALQQTGLLQPPLGHVAGDLGEPDHLAVVIPYGVDDRKRPELAAVGAHPPASDSNRPVRAAAASARWGNSVAWSSGVKNFVNGWPMISSALYPLSLAAPEFQLATRPSRSIM